METMIATAEIGLMRVSAQAGGAAKKSATAFALKFRGSDAGGAGAGFSCPAELPRFLPFDFKMDASEGFENGARRGTKIPIVILSYAEKNKKKEEGGEGGGEKKRERVYKGHLLVPRAPMCPGSSPQADLLDYQVDATGHVRELTCPAATPCAPPGHPVTHTEAP